MNKHITTQAQARNMAREAGGVFVDGYAVRALADLVGRFNRTPYADEEERSRLGGLLAAHVEALVQNAPPTGRNE